MAEAPARQARADIRPFVLGCYTLHATGITVTGKPTYEEHLGVGEFIQQARKSASWWMADWLRYGDRRRDWHDRLDQAVNATGLQPKTLKNVRALGDISTAIRRNDVDFSLHEVVAAMPPDEQRRWLERAASHGLNRHERRREVRAAKRRKVLDGQAVLAGMFRVVYADPPWSYGNRPPSGSGAADHYNGMTIEKLCKLPVGAHCYEQAVLFMWVTAPMLYENPGPREVIEAWGFMPKTGLVWDKVDHNFGNYVSVRHEHLIIATRGSCLPDRPTPMPDSVYTERPTEHSAKPAGIRKVIEALYDGPYLELFAREAVDGWACFGDDAALWHHEVA